MFLCISVCVKAFPDELRIPFPCWPNELQAEFKSIDKKLDIHVEDRTEDSWAYLVNEGDTFKLFTYHSITPEEFEQIQKIVFKVDLDHQKGNE